MENAAEGDGMAERIGNFKIFSNLLFLFEFYLIKSYIQGAKKYIECSAKTKDAVRGLLKKVLSNIWKTFHENMT